MEGELLISWVNFGLRPNITHTHTHTDVGMYIYTYICVCMYVCIIFHMIYVIMIHDYVFTCKEHKCLLSS